MYYSSRKQTHDKPLIANCVVCGADLYPSKYGRAKRTCSDKCRKEAQRRREQGEKMQQVSATRRTLERYYQELPDEVVKLLRSMERDYSVYAAYDACQVVRLALQTVTSDPSRFGGGSCENGGAHE